MRPGTTAVGLFGARVKLDEAAGRAAVGGEWDELVPAVLDATDETAGLRVAGCPARLDYHAMSNVGNMAASMTLAHLGHCGWKSGT